MARFAVALLIAIAPVASLAEPFPPGLAATQISGALSVDFEPSGAAWNPATHKLFLCGDNGAIARMNADGTATTNWELAGDWEGLAIADPLSTLIYLVNERTAAIQEFDTASGAATREFNLTAAAGLTNADRAALVDDGDGNGAEALAFVPIAGDPEGGQFYVGSQENGTIYRFRLTLSGGVGVAYLGKFKTWPANNNDLASLEYDWRGNRILAMWDGQDTIRAISTTGTILRTWDVPADSNDEEALAYTGTALFIGRDPAPQSEVWRYDGFRIDAAESDWALY